MAKQKKDLNKVLLQDTAVSAADIGYDDMDNVEANWQEVLRTDPKYSLQIDPTNRYNFTEQETDFISYMIQYKNVQFVSTVLMNIPLEEGVNIYKKYDVQQEIKRINLAMYARRFATKMADLDQLGGYLTSGLIDENVPVAERWSAKEKITASKLLMTLNMLKQKAVNKPEVVEVVEIQKDLEKLSPNELKQLIEYNDDENLEKEKLIELINEDGLLTMEELKNLRMMSVEELQDLLSTITEGEIEDDGEED